MWWGTAKLGHTREVGRAHQEGLLRRLDFILWVTSSTPSVHEPLETRHTCVYVYAFFSIEGKCISASSNGEPVEGFCQECFGESCMYTCGQAEVNQSIHAERQGNQ